MTEDLYETVFDATLLNLHNITNTLRDTAQEFQEVYDEIRELHNRLDYPDSYSDFYD